MTGGLCCWDARAARVQTEAGMQAPRGGVATETLRGPPSSLSDIIWTNGKGHRQLERITLPLQARSDTLYVPLTDGQACLYRHARIYSNSI